MVEVVAIVVEGHTISTSSTPFMTRRSRTRLSRRSADDDQLDDEQPEALRLKSVILPRSWRG
jgi:hypothetical protein